MALIKMSKRTKREACKRCGDTGPFYWAQDDATEKFYLVNKTPETLAAGMGDPISEDTKHVCGAAKPEPTPAPAPVEVYTPVVITPAPANVSKPWPASDPLEPPAPAPAGTDARMAQMFAMMQDIFATPQIDRAQVEAIARDVVNGVVYPTQTVVIRDGIEKKIEGTTHYQLASVIKATRRRNVMLVGPAGSGKSHIAEQVAEALSLPFYSLSLTTQTPVSAIVGYMDATGNYHGTAFREAYENGGVFCLDETDNGHPNTLGAINSAIANGTMAFPDGMVKRNADFRLIATANTFGRGATRAYVGRNQLDAAFLNRFVKLNIRYDDALELSMCKATGVSTETVDKVLRYVRKVRKNAETNGINVIVSPRNSEAMCDLIAEDFTFDEAIDAALRDGIDDAQWAKLTS